MIVLIFRVDKSTLQASLLHEIRLHYSAFPQHASLLDMNQRIHPNGRRILLHYKEHTVGIVNHVFQYAHINCLTALIDK